MSDYCHGCGADTTGMANRRLLSTVKSSHLLATWNAFISSVGISFEGSPAGYLCRSCASAFGRYADLQKELTEKLDNALERLPSLTECAPKRMRIDGSHAPGHFQKSAPSCSTSPNVGVYVGYKHPKSYLLTPSRKHIGKAVGRGSRKAIARECVKDPLILKYVLGSLGSAIKKELKAVASDDNSLLKGQSIPSMKNFGWEKVLDELKLHAPIFLHIFQSITTTKSERPNQNAIIGMCASLLLKHRYSKMSMMQKIVSIILHAGRASKQVYTRLQKLNICMSHQTVVRLIDQMGQNYDSKVKEWQENLTKKLTHQQQNQPMDIDNDLSNSGHSDTLSDSDVDPVSEDESDSSDCTAPPYSPLSVQSSSESETSSDVSSSEASVPPSDNESSSDNDSSLGHSSDSEDENEEDELVLQCAPQNTAEISNTIPELSSTTYTITGDNIDKSIKPRYMRVNSGNQLLHYFHYFATRDRVDASNLSILPPPPPTLTPAKCAISLLPSPEDDKEIRRNIIIHISRILAAHLDTLGFDCSSLVERHIPHKHQEEMSRKSEVVPLGVILKNENKASEMIEIMDQIHSYTPTKQYTEEFIETSTNEVINIPKALIHPVLFGGDQLTAARARGAKRAKANSIDPCLKFDGLIPVAEDWHTKLNFLGVIWRYFMSTASSSDHGSLYQLRNILNRTNVVKDPTKNFNACDDFFQSIVSGHVIAAFEEVVPEDFDPSTYWMKSDSERKQLLFQFSSEIAEKFVDFSYNEHSKKVTKDKVQEYAIQLMSLGCFYMEFLDSIKEGDGGRIHRCARYLLPIFWNSRRTNYANEVLNMLYQYDFSMSPCHKQQLLWSRCINVHGRRGKNIPADLHMEHLNRVVKDCIRGLGANKTEKAILRVSRALGTIIPILDNFDLIHGVSEISGAHKRKSTGKDVLAIANELRRRKVFHYTSPRKHNKFPNPRNVLHDRKKEDIVEWMTCKLSKLRKS